MSKINETNYPRRIQANYADTDMLVLQAAGGNTYTTRIEDLRDDYEATLAPTIDKINDALAPAENGATASQSYAIGEHFMRDGAFCTAIAAITSGGSFTLNTNYKVDDVANNLEQLNSDLTAINNKFPLFYASTFTEAVTANTETTINVTTPSGYSYGWLIGLQGNSNSNAIELITIRANGSALDGVRVKSTVAQTVYVRTIWVKNI